MRNIMAASLFIFLISCMQKMATTATPTVKQDSEIHFKIFANDTVKSTINYAGFGYDIYLNNHLYIHQPGIPAISENKGFLTASAAQKIAELVVYKIQHNIMPPSVSIQELDSLAVI